MKRSLTIFVFMMTLLSLALMITAAQDDDGVCPAGQGYWKNHPDEWPVATLQIGGQFYTDEELMVLLDTPVTGDASLILAHQLIAAKLNISVGADVTVASQVLIDADAALAEFEGKLPYGISHSAEDGNDLVIFAGTLDVFNSGLLTEGCDDIEATPEVTPEMTMEPEMTPEPEMTEEPEITPEPTPEDGAAVIIIEGPITAININIITIYNIDIVVDPDDPVLVAIQVGDVIRVEGEIADPGTLVNIDIDVDVTLVLVAINVTYVNIEIYVGNDGGVWRDDSECSNPPPPWAPAHGWRRKCEGR